MCPEGVQIADVARQIAAEGAQCRRERELHGQDERDEDRGADDNEGTGAAELGYEEERQQLANGSTWTNLARAAEARIPPFLRDPAESQGQEGGEPQQQDEHPEALRVRGLDRLAPEERPAQHAQSQGDEVGRPTEELRHQELGHERTSRPHVVASGPVAAGLEECRRILRFVGGQADDEQQPDSEAEDAQHLDQPPRLDLFLGHCFRTRPP